MSTGWDNGAALSSLRKRWWAFAAFSLGFLAAGYLLISAGEQPRSTLSGLAFPLHWLLICAAVLSFELRILWKGLSDNYKETDAGRQLLPDLGPGSLLTLLRGVLIAGVSGFLFAGEPSGWLRWVPAVLFTLAISTDFLDGYLARITDHVTQLGKSLDLNFDSITVLSGALLAVQYGQVPWWYASVALARYVFIVGLWVRRRMGLPVFDLPPNQARRGLAGVQMCFIAAVLWPVFAPPGTQIAAVAFALPFLAGFGRDWLAVSGMLPGTWQAAVLPQGLRSWLPVFLRLLAAGLMLAQLLNRIASFSVGSGSDMLWILAVSLAEGIILLSAALGAAGRIAAILGLILVGTQQAITGISPAQVILIVAFTMLLFMGTGRLSLWTPEEEWIHHRAGEKRARRMERAA